MIGTMKSLLYFTGISNSPRDQAIKKRIPKTHPFQLDHFKTLTKHDRGKEKKKIKHSSKVGLLAQAPKYPNLLSPPWLGTRVGGVSPKNAGSFIVREMGRFFAICLDHLWFSVDSVMVEGGWTTLA